MRVGVAACAVVAAGGPPLDAWLAFHRGVGVERFHLYRTGDAAVPSATDITRVDWPFAAPHRPAWDHCLYHHGPDAEWLALLEPDEYLFATDGTDLATALADFRAWPGVGVARTIFAPAEGDAPAIRRAAADLVLALPPFLRATGLDPARYDSYRPLAARCGFVVQPARTCAVLGRHAFGFRDDAAAVTETGEALEDGWADRPSFARLRLNQYLSEAGETLQTRFGDAAPVRRRATAAELAPFRTEIDTAILPLRARGRILVS